MNFFNAFFLHALATLLWLFFSDSPSLISVFIGIGIGFVFLRVFGPLFGTQDYNRRWWGVIRFAGIFLREFLMSNVVVGWAVLSRKKANIHPRFFEYDVSHLTEVEILILSHAITLTPGTCSIEVSTDSALPAADVGLGARSESEQRVHETYTSELSDAASLRGPLEKLSGWVSGEPRDAATQDSGVGRVRKVLVIHAFDGEDPASVRHSIKSSLEEGILRFTR